MRYFLIGSFLAFIVPPIVMLLIFEAFYHPELAWAWILSAFYGLSGIVIRRRSKDIDPDHFLIWRLGMNGIRVIVFVAWMIVLRWWGIESFAPFVVASFAGYLCYLLTDVVDMYFESMSDG